MPQDTPDLWLRRTVELSANLPQKMALYARYGQDTEIYINGLLAASVKGSKDDYVALPIDDAVRASLRPGKNVIAIHAHQPGEKPRVFADVGIIQALN